MRWNQSYSRNLGPHGKGGKEAGTEIVIETLEQIKKIAAGVHIMPLNDIDTTLYIIDHV